MRRPVLAAVLAALAVPALGAPAQGAVHGRFFPGAPLDAGVAAVGGADLARDGSGAIAYTKADAAGVRHVFVVRLAGGAFQRPERIDGALPDAASQPVVAAGEGGRLAVAFVSGSTVVAAERPSARRPWGAPQPLAAGSDPAVDISINGAAYVAFTAPGAGGHDVRAARLERRGTTFALLGAPLDVASDRDAGVGPGRSRVAVAADGSAVVTWGEAGEVFARRLFEQRLSDFPQDVAGADAADVGLEDDSSFGWAVVRSGASILARRLLGSTFDPPVPLFAGAGAGEPRLSLASRGDGYVGFSAGGTALASVIKDDVPRAPVALGRGAVGPVVPVAAANGDGAVAFEQGAGVTGRVYDAVLSSRAVTRPGAPARLARPQLGAADTVGGGLAGGADGSGNVVFAFVQGPGRTLAGATFDRAPGFFLPSTTSVSPRRRALRWSKAADNWGAVRYTVFVDGRAVARTTGRAQVALRRLPPAGRHRWYVVATDRRGQRTRSRSITLRVTG